MSQGGAGFLVGTSAIPHRQTEGLRMHELNIVSTVSGIVEFNSAVDAILSVGEPGSFDQSKN